MKSKYLKSILAAVLSVIMLMSFAAPTYASETVDAPQIVYLDEDELTGDLFENILDAIHNLVASVFSRLGMSCPFCENHGVSETTDNVKTIVAAYNKAVNDLKAYEGKITLVYKNSVDFDVMEVPSAAQSILEKVLDSFDGTTTMTYNFENGADENDISITDVIAPCGRAAALKSKGVKKAFMETLNGKTTITFTIKSEEIAYDGTSMTKDSVYNKGVISSTLNVGDLEMDPVTVTAAEGSYTGTKVRAVLDSEGRLTNLKIYAPFELSATAKVSTISMTVGISMEDTDAFKVVYK